MIQIDDQDILRLIRKPETKDRGFRILIEQYQRRTYQVIRRMVLIHEDADDLTQNTFIKAYRHLEKFREDSGLYTWIYRIAVNETLSFLEKKEKSAFSSLWTIIRKSWKPTLTSKEVLMEMKSKKKAG